MTLEKKKTYRSISLMNMIQGFSKKKKSTGKLNLQPNQKDRTSLSSGIHSRNARVGQHSPVLNYTERIKSKNLIVTQIDAEKASDKI